MAEAVAVAGPQLLAIAQIDLVACLIVQHTDGPGLLALMRASKECRDWVLRSAPEAALQLDLRSAEPHTLWLRRLVAVRECLEARGPGAPLQLCILCSGSTFTGVLLALICQYLGPACHRVTELVIRPYMTQPDSQTAAFFIQSMASMMPKLNQLTLHTFATLPPPTALPSLAELVVKVGDSSDETAGSVLCSTVGACAKQLTSLVFYNYGRNAVPYEALLPSTTYTLTHLDISKALDDQFTGLLLDRAPELTHLSVTECQLSHTHQNKQWKVTSLELTGLEQDMEHIGRLPTCGAGTVDVCMGSTDCRLGTVICTLQREDNGLQAAIHGRLSEWRFNVSKVVFSIQHVETPEQAIAVAHILSHIGNLQAPGALIELHGSEWTEEGVRAVRNGLPSLPHLRFGLYTVRLDGHMLPELLACGELLACVSATLILLETDQHANAEWRWGQFAPFILSTARLLRLPLPGAGNGMAPLLKCSGCRVDTIPDQDSQARIEQWLGRVRWASDDHTPVTFEVYSSNPETQTGSAADLHKQLSVLHRVQFADTQTHSARLHLEGWPMTQEVLQALSALPHTFRHLAFTKCKWPLKPSAYRDVAVYVWDSLRSLKLCDVPRDVVKSICKAMARDREGLGLPPLVVQSEHFAQGHFGPHIEVSNGPNAYR